MTTTISKPDIKTITLELDKKDYRKLSVIATLKSTTPEKLILNDIQHTIDYYENELKTINLGLNIYG